MFQKVNDLPVQKHELNDKYVSETAYFFEIDKTKLVKFLNAPKKDKKENK